MASLSARGIASGSVVAGRYEIVDALGTGGMATVFRAHDRALDVAVALKVLKASASRDPELAQRFRSEIKLAWRVRHRNVCGIHEYGEDGDLLYISMELVEGQDLKRLLRDGPFVWERAYDVAVQIAEGLEAIHEAGVIHRDLKPANITRDASGLVRLMDFGIAKVWGEESGGAATRTGHVVGSPEYMSPEQVRGTSLDFRSDLYALGLVIYELFTGSVPFRCETPLATMMKRLEHEPDWNSPAARRIPTAALPILRKALARDPAGRQSNCTALLAELRAARTALPHHETDADGSSRTPEVSGLPPRPRVRAPIFSREAQARLLVTPLAKAVKHADPGVRLGAVEALGRLLGDALLAAPAPVAAQALDAALRDDDEAVRAAAAVSLTRLRAPQPGPVPSPSAPAPSVEAGVRETQTTVPPSVRPTPSFPGTRGGARAVAPAAVLAVVLAVLGWRALHSPPYPEARLSPSSPPSIVSAPPSTAAIPPVARQPSEAPERPVETPQPSVPTPRPTKPPSRPSAQEGGARLPEIASSPASPSPLPLPELEREPEPPPISTPAPASTPTDEPPPPTTQAPAPVMPAVCLSCPVPEAAVVLRERLALPRSVRLRIQVSETGEVLRVDYLAGPSPIRDTITRAAMRWRYQPAQRGDRAVPSYVVVDLEL